MTKFDSFLSKINFSVTDEEKKWAWGKEFVTKVIQHLDFLNAEWQYMLYFYVIPMQANILEVSEHLLKHSGRARAPGSRRLGFDSRSILSFLLLQYKNLLNRVPQGGASKRVMRTAMKKFILT